MCTIYFQNYFLAEVPENCSKFLCYVPQNVSGDIAMSTGHSAGLAMLLKSSLCGLFCELFGNCDLVEMCVYCQ